MNAGERERAGRRSSGWNGKAVHREFSRSLAERAEMREAAATAAAARTRAVAARSLTADFCGDPLPGQSALDRRMRGGRHGEE